MRRLAYHLPSQIKHDLKMEGASRTVVNLQSYVFQGDLVHIDAIPRSNGKQISITISRISRYGRDW
jgi:hypothetical protein